MRYRIIAVFSLAAVCGCARRPECGQNLCSVDPAVQAQHDAAFVSQRGGRNLTAEFTRRFCGPEDVQNAHVFEGCDVLLVHGWLGETGIRFTNLLDKLSCNQRILDYLKDQRYAADELGLCSLAPTFRSEAVCASGEQLACLIAAHRRRVLIVAHSKGCLDSLDALLRLQRLGQLNKVAGFIAIQGPFYGSAEAATFMERNNPIGKLRIRLLGARIQGVCDMMPSTREEYMAQNQSQIAAVVQAVPTLCFASWKNMECPDGLMTDGHVEPASAILPGADYIAKCGITHAQPVLSRKSLPFDRLGFTKTLIGMLSQKAEPASPKP